MALRAARRRLGRIAFPPHAKLPMVTEFFDRIAGWYLRLGPVKRGLLTFAVLVFTVEVLFRTFGRRTRAYKAWTRAFEAIGHVWSVVILAIIYFLSVGPTSLLMRLAGKDLLDARLDPEPSFWRKHEPNPLGAARAARHQF